MIIWSKFSNRKEKQIEEEIGSKTEAIGSASLASKLKTEANGFEPHFKTTGIQNLWHHQSLQIGESHTEEASRVEKGLAVAHVR
jgi:hypothetical protein